MKKLLFILTICILSAVSVSAQSKIPDTAQLTLLRVYNDTKAGLEGLAGPLKVGATHVYEVVVKQQKVDSIIWLIVDCTLLFLSVISWIFWFRDKDDRDEWWGVPAVLSFLFIVSIVCNISIIVGGFVNPEYGAIEYIISFIKEK